MKNCPVCKKNPVPDNRMLCFEPDCIRQWRDAYPYELQRFGLTRKPIPGTAEKFSGILAKVAPELVNLTEEDLDRIIEEKDDD